MQLTQQIKIEPSPSQEIVLQALSEKCRLIYNFALKERKEAFGQGIKGVNYIKQQNDLPKLKGQFPEYSWVYSKVLQYTLRTLDADYKSFFALHKKGDKNARLPNFKGKNFFTTMTYNQSGVKSGKGWVEFSHKHPIGTKLRFAIPEQFLFSRIYQASVYRKEKRYFLSIVYDKEEKEFVDNQQYQAFDLGVMKQTAVNL
ncbi:MAG: helix-turn-helix domain-containing protein, partial [Nanoarchaeota archaeon]|nr:helix-turn-helix domain-containing protein [Nanoarchaeota archaeon]